MFVCIFKLMAGYHLESAYQEKVTPEALSGEVFLRITQGCRGELKGCRSFRRQRVSSRGSLTVNEVHAVNVGW